MIIQAVSWGWSEILWASLIGFVLVFVVLVALIFIMKGLGVCFQRMATTSKKQAVAPQPMISLEEIAAIATALKIYNDHHLRRQRIIRYTAWFDDKTSAFFVKAADISPCQSDQPVLRKHLICLADIYF